MSNTSVHTNLDLTIVIPAHNEAGRISPMLSSYIEHFRGRAQLMPVLNGCTDDTKVVVDDIVASLAAGDMVTVIDIADPIGKAGAVYEGFRLATTAAVGFVDADGSTPSYEFERLFHELHGVDGVIGSRRMPHSHVANRTVVRRFISWTFAEIARASLRMPYRDTQCGAKIFRTAAVQSVLPHLTVKNSAFDLDLLIQLKRAGYTVKEEPTYWVDNSSSTMFTSPLKLIRASWDMYKTVRQLHHTTRHG